MERIGEVYERLKEECPFTKKLEVFEVYRNLVKDIESFAYGDRVKVELKRGVILVISEDPTILQELSMRLKISEIEEKGLKVRFRVARG